MFQKMLNTTLVERMKNKWIKLFSPWELDTHSLNSIVEIGVQNRPLFTIPLCKITSRIVVGSRCDLGRNPAGYQNPGGTPAEFRQDSRREATILAAKLSPWSCCKSHQDSRREAKLLAAKISPRFSPVRKNPGGQTLATILPQISPRFSPRSKHPGGQNFAGILLWISPRTSQRS